jgi:dTDP-4-dehydrorhamnose 3,5-epimerase
VNVTRAEIPDVVFIEPRVFPDSRGSFRTVFRADEYAAAGLLHEFKQDNVSVSRGGVLRGLHFQHPNAQAKLVYAVRGSIFDVAVDVRKNSPTYGRAVWATLSAENRRQILIPGGFAHGFFVASEEAVVVYKCSDVYAPQSEHTIRWDDPTLGIPWPAVSPIMSERDAAAPLLSELPRELLP